MTGIPSDSESPSGAQSPPVGEVSPDALGSAEAEHRTALGRAGEDIAAAWYEEHGYEVLERNWRRREGEVDLIARKRRTVAFCEVKTRTSDTYGTGAESVLPAKQRRIRRLAIRWLAELTPSSGRALVDLRFDVISITAGEIEVIEDAF